MKQCSICNTLIDLKVERENEHHEECHPEKENITLKKAFGRILLTCGAGHMEKNLLLVTFKLLVVGLFGELKYLLNFSFEFFFH